MCFCGVVRFLPLIRFAWSRWSFSQHSTIFLIPLLNAVFMFISCTLIKDNGDAIAYQHDRYNGWSCLDLTDSQFSWGGSFCLRVELHLFRLMALLTFLVPIATLIILPLFVPVAVRSQVCSPLSLLTWLFRAFGRNSLRLRWTSEMSLFSSLGRLS